MQQFPYILVSWKLKDLTGDLDDEFEFQRYINEVKVSFQSQ